MHSPAHNPAAAAIEETRDLHVSQSHSDVDRSQRSIVVICMAIALLDGLDVQAIGVAAPALAREWGVRPQALSGVFSAAPAGMLAGAVIMGRIGDAWGRRRPIIVATVLFGLCTALTAFAPTIAAMTVVRFFAGLGLGGVLPNLISHITEFAPDRLRGRLTTLTFSSLPFGAMLAALLAQWLIPAFGWRSLFYVGGALPLVAAAVAIARLPESSRYLQAKSHAVKSDAGPPASFARLLEPEHRWTTVALIVVTAIDMFMLYFALNWLPVLLERAGQPTGRALTYTVVANISGGLGAMTWGLLIDRIGGSLAMMLAGAAACLGLALIGGSYDHPALLILALVLAGAAINGGLPGLYVVIASSYPTPMRSTGVGTVLGVARFGSIAGPAAGGLFLARGWSIEAIFYTIASLGVIWAAGMLLIRPASSRRP